MSKVTKNERIKELERQVRGLTVLCSSLNTWSEYADSMLTELNHALPDPEYDAECEADEPAISASLDRHRERLGLNKPQLKQLDQSIFKEWADCWKFFAIDEDGDAWRYREKPKIDNGDNRWSSSNTVPLLIGTGYDASNWQNSLIERDIVEELAEVDLSSELTGSELVRAMLERGDRCVMCMVANNEANMFLATRPVVVHGCTDSGFISVAGCYSFAVAVNNQGEPLIQAEVGL